ncbi:MAG: hypothetical protein WKF92_05625 [Pyrinomonadaceae bacterium]
MPKQEMGRDLSAGGPGTGENINGINRGDELTANKPNIAGQQISGSGQNTADRGVLDLAKESGGQIADKAIGTAKEKASSVVDEQKTNLAAGLGSIAGELRRTGENLRSSGDKNQFAGLGANYGEKIADKVDGLSKYLENADLRDLAGDLEKYARRNPAVFIGGAFLLGLAATRFIKSSSSATSARRFESSGDIRTVNPPRAQGQPGL